MNLVFVIISGRSGWQSCDKLGMNLPKLCTDPKNDRNCFKFLGDVKFNIADVLVSSCAIPDWVNL